ncbi:MAG: tRNA dihydrouridine(20/20a) synthase DusA [Alphaproteobacteria bacterium]
MSVNTELVSRRVSVAPMMDWTDRHCRFFLRLISKRVWLYTEMVTPGALIHGDRQRFLQFHPTEHPIALQLGGSEPADLAIAAKLGEDYGYDEINLNLGCPSDRVQQGRFGACLMREPDLVASCLKAMQAVVAIPVTVKCRLGVDEMDDYAPLHNFVERVRDAGCRTIIVHARKALLQGLSPKENREIPPLRPELVYQLKDEFPALEIIINGGIRSLDLMDQHLAKGVDGVMLGRAAYQDPYILATIDHRFYGVPSNPPRHADILEKMIPYIDRHIAEGGRLWDVARHILGLANNLRGARNFRRIISEGAREKEATTDVIRRAFRELVLDTPIAA